MEDAMSGLGRHILAEFYGCEFDDLNNLDRLKAITLKAVQKSGATIVSHHFQSFEPHGVSGVVIISESHISFHTWPEHGYVAFDYFTCGKRVDIHLAIDLLAEHLCPKNTTRALYTRGEALGKAPHRPESLAADFPEEKFVGERGVHASDYALPSEHWMTEYELDCDSNRRFAAYNYLSTEPIFSDTSELQEIAVIQNPLFGKMLFIDGCVMTTEADEFVYHEMLAHVPLILHPHPCKALIIGGGDGGLLAQVLRHSTLEYVDMVEIDGKVISLCQKHLPSIARAFHDRRANIHLEDGASFVKQKKDRSYDVILVDSTDPVGEGLSLYHPQFYTEVKRILTPEGIFAAQSLSPWFQKTEQRAMYRALGKIWPHVAAYHATIPSYPGGMWTFACCAKTAIDPNYFDVHRARQIAKDSQYYTPEIQTAVFHLPQYIEKNTVAISNAAR